jgi:hypothetical protein
MDGKRAAGELAVGTRGSFKGKRAGTGKGRGKAKAVSGGLFENPPEKNVQINLLQLGIDKKISPMPPPCPRSETQTCPTGRFAAALPFFEARSGRRASRKL